MHFAAFHTVNTCDRTTVKKPKMNVRHKESTSVVVDKIINVFNSINFYRICEILKS